MGANPLEFKVLSAKRLAAVRHVGPYNLIGPAFRELGKIAAAAGLFKSPGAMMTGIYLDDPALVPHDKLRSAAALVVGDDVAIPAGLVEERIEPGEYACLTHVGSYEGLPGAWARISEALRTSGRLRANAPSYELYWNDPTQVPEAELKTEICLPVK